jgi:hypothetical protein
VAHNVESLPPIPCTVLLVLPLHPLAHRCFADDAGKADDVHYTGRSAEVPARALVAVPTVIRGNQLERSVIWLSSPTIGERLSIANDLCWNVLGAIHPQNPGVGTGAVPRPDVLDPREPQGMRVRVVVTSDVDEILSTIQNAVNCAMLVGACAFPFVSRTDDAAKDLQAVPLVAWLDKIM